MKTICGVDLDLLKERPRPEELADIVAEWNSGQQAEFLMTLGEKLRTYCGGKVAMQWEYLARDIRDLEKRLHDDSATELLQELTERLMAPIQ
jgi:hypothetical protein